MTITSETKFVARCPHCPWQSTTEHRDEAEQRLSDHSLVHRFNVGDRVWVSGEVATIEAAHHDQDRFQVTFDRHGRCYGTSETGTHCSGCCGKVARTWQGPARLMCPASGQEQP